MLANRNFLYLVSVCKGELEKAEFDVLRGITPKSTDTMLITWNLFDAEQRAHIEHIKYGSAHFSYVTKELLEDMGCAMPDDDNF